MRYSEALKRIKSAISLHNLTEDLEEALEVAIPCIEKQIPMRCKDIHVDEYHCPKCYSENCGTPGYFGDNFCPGVVKEFIIKTMNTVLVIHLDWRIFKLWK